MAQTAQVDEFEEAATQQDGMSGYEALRNADVEDQREYRLIPNGTPCTLGVVNVSLGLPKPGTAGKPALLIKTEVLEPKEYADGSSNFTVRLSLNATVNPGKESSGLDMTVKILSWLYAGCHQTSSREGKAAMFDSVLQNFPNITQDDVPAFHAALVSNANEQLKGQTFRTKKIGVDIGKPNGKVGDDGVEGKYLDKQSYGIIDYPKSARK